MGKNALILIKLPIVITYLVQWRRNRKMFRQDPEDNSKIMRIATFNLESLDAGSKSAASLADRIAILRPQLMRLDADVLCLQEVNSQRTKPRSQRQLIALRELLKETQYSDFECISTTAGETGSVADVHNLVVLSRYPVTSFRELRNDIVCAPRYQCATAIPRANETLPITWDRPILHVSLELDNGQALHVFNVHLRAPLASPVRGQKSAPFVWKSSQGWAEGYFLAAIKRAGQALELRLAIDQVLDADPQAFTIVCGDMNVDEHEAPFRIVLAAEEDTGNGKLANRTLVPLERSIAQDRRFTVLHHGRPVMLDHILVSHALLGCFRHIQIHNETIGDELVGFARVDKPPNSYHAPVIAEFTFD